MKMVKSVDGDQIMYICAKYMNEHGRLKHGTVVSTVMSNLGFYKALEGSWDRKYTNSGWGSICCRGNEEKWL